MAKRWITMLVAALALLAASCGGDSTTETTTVTAAAPSTTTTAPAETSTTATVAPEGTELRSGEDQQLPPGTYRTSLLGTEVAFATQYPWQAYAYDGLVSIDGGPDQLDGAFFLARGRLADGGTDPVAYLESLDGVTVVGNGEFPVKRGDGFQTVTRIEAVTDRSEPTNLLAAESPLLLAGQETYTIWYIDQGEHDPLIAFGFVPGEYSELLNRVEEIMFSLTIGEPSPSPVATEAAAAPCPGGGEALTGDPVGPGAYCTDLLGVEIGFSTGQDWVIPVLEPGTLILEDPGTPIGVNALLLLRGNLADDSTDPEQWFADEERVTVVSAGSTTVGGFEAQVFDVTTDAPGEIAFLTVGPPLQRIVLRSGEYYRIWWIETDAADPLVGFAPVGTGDEGWLERADEIMASVTAGEAGPVAEGPDGEVSGPYTVAGFSLGSLSFVLPEPAKVIEVHPGLTLVQLPGRDAGVIFFAPRQTADGEPLPDAEAVRTAFAAATALADGPSATILGHDLVAVEAADRLALPLLSPDPISIEPQQLAFAPEFGFDYLIDTAGGPFLVGVFANAEDGIDPAIEFFAAVLDSIELG